MNSSLLTTALLAISAFTFAGCADQTTATASAGNPTDRTYTRGDLDRSGRQTTGEAIQAVDPSVQVSSGGSGGAHP